MAVRLTSRPVNGLHTGPALFIFCGLMYGSAITLKTLVTQQRCKRKAIASRAARIATVAGPGDYFAALAFSPRGNLLAGVTYHGNVLVFRVASPGRPARVTTRPGILASARFPGGGSTQAGPCGGDCGFAAAYAVGFTPDGHALTVVIDRPEAWPSPAARDTVFTWQVTGSGDLSDLTTIFRDVSDAQPVLAPGGRIVADGSLTGGEVHLWTLP